MATARRHRRSRIWRRRGARALAAFSAVIVVGLGVHLLGAQGQTRTPSVSAPVTHAAGPTDAVALGALCPSTGSDGGGAATATGQGATGVPVALSPQVCVSAAPAVVPEAGLPLVLSASGTAVLFGAVMLSARRGRSRGPAPVTGLG